MLAACDHDARLDGSEHAIVTERAQRLPMKGEYLVVVDVQGKFAFVTSAIKRVVVRL